MLKAYSLTVFLSLFLFGCTASNYYTKEKLLLGLKLEKSKINDISSALKTNFTKRDSKLGTWSFISIDISKIPIPNVKKYLLIVENNKVIRGASIYLDVNQFQPISSALHKKYKILEPYYSVLQTFVDEKDVIELTYSNNFKYTLLEITSASLRQERIEYYKIEASKGNELYQRILHTIKVPY